MAPPDIFPLEWNLVEWFRSRRLHDEALGSDPNLLHASDMLADRMGSTTRLSSEPVHRNSNGAGQALCVPVILNFAVQSWQRGLDQLAPKTHLSRPLHGRPACFTPAQAQVLSIEMSFHCYSAGLLRERSILGRIRRQFMQDQGNCLCRVWREVQRRPGNYNAIFDVDERSQLLFD